MDRRMEGKGERRGAFLRAHLPKEIRQNKMWMYKVVCNNTNDKFGKESASSRPIFGSLRNIFIEGEWEEERGRREEEGERVEEERGEGRGERLPYRQHRTSSRGGK